MEITSFNEIDWKSFIIGTVVFTALVVLGSEVELLYYGTFIGLLYIGYKSKDYIQGMFLGAIATIPAFITITQTHMFGIINNNTAIIILIALLALGVILGFVGSHLSKQEKKAMKQREIDLKQEIASSKKKSSKSKRNSNKNRNSFFKFLKDKFKK